jgi:hypothetical protein
MEISQQEWRAQLNKELQLALPEKSDFAAMRLALASHLNHLANTAFEQLISLLYRIDVNENKIKNLLSLPHTDAGLILADLVLERLQEKIKSRKQYQSPPTGEQGEETW